jgi:hypothetical protein
LQFLKKPDVNIKAGGKILDSVRYKNPTPNPLPASEEGAIMYLK